jgi:hypothetical protein
MHCSKRVYTPLVEVNDKNHVDAYSYIQKRAVLALTQRSPFDLPMAYLGDTWPRELFLYTAECRTVQTARSACR